MSRDTTFMESNNLIFHYSVSSDAARRRTGDTVDRNVVHKGRVKTETEKKRNQESIVNRGKVDGVCSF